MCHVNTQGVVGQIGRIRERANALIERELAARGIEGIVPHHGAVLAFLLGQSGPVPIKAVVEHVGRVKSTVTQTLKTLERYGYVRRTPCERDRRVVYVGLTDAGRALRGPMNEISRTLLSRFYAGMNEGEQKDLVLLLDRVEANLA
jgi:DNA-binding MarR family transcriptional regulator